MLSIRLSRTGKKNQPSYRVIVSEKTKDPWGTYLEILGYYNPRKAAEIFSLKEERLKYWISKGAKLSATVNNLLVNQGVLNVPKVRIVKVKKSKKTKEDQAEVTEPEKKKETAAKV